MLQPHQSPGTQGQGHAEASQQGGRVGAAAAQITWWPQLTARHKECDRPDYLTVLA